MRLIQFPWRAARTLALVLFCLCFIVSFGNAEEAAGAASVKQAAESVPVPAQGASAANGPASAPVQELSSDELATLSARAEEPGPDVVGGALTNTQLTYIVIALATAVIVLIAK